MGGAIGTAWTEPRKNGRAIGDNCSTMPRRALVPAAPPGNAMAKGSAYPPIQPDRRRYLQQPLSTLRLCLSTPGRQANMNDARQTRPRRFRFSLRTVLILVGLIALVLGWIEYRKQAAKPDLSITAADVAWASDTRIWKIDLTRFKPVYGVRLVAISNNGADRKQLAQLGGHSPDEWKEDLVVRVAIRREAGKLCGKFGQLASSMDFELLTPNRNATSWHGPLGKRRNNQFILMEWSATGDFGSPSDGTMRDCIVMELIDSPDDAQ